ncbi:hypothetical protein M569_00477, partial [Genlisea aurea]
SGANISDQFSRWSAAAVPAVINHSRLRAEGPSCLFVGPLETATQENLEALYRQARKAYYSGQPLIVDDMFDRVELKLRSYGSKYVVKYPRCSLRRHSTYADAEEDPSQVFALSSVWLLILGFGTSACLVPVAYAITRAYRDAFNSSGVFYAVELFSPLSCMLFVLFGAMVGYPIASASVGALRGLWVNDLVALKGICPHCGEEVYAFVGSKQWPHRVECHVCKSSLEFRTKVVESVSAPGKRWVYGRVYLIRAAKR